MNINFYSMYFNFFIFNLFFFFKKNKFNLDVFYSFFSNPYIILIFVYTEIKKILFFFKNFKYNYKSIYNIIKYYYNIVFIIWRPLFKRWSYFGYFRSNRSKWLK